MKFKNSLMQDLTPFFLNFNSFKMLRNGRWLSSLTALCFSILFHAELSAGSASFDCMKKLTDVEKLICSNIELLELDNEIDAFYKKALSMANNELRTELIKHQKHWLKFTRNLCADDLCIKHAYWSKLAELKTFIFVNNLNTHDPSYKKSPYQSEAEKLEPIKQILAVTKMRSASNQPEFCQAIFDDLKQMNNISFVEAKVKTNSYEDIALDPWKQSCKIGQLLNLGYECDPKVNPGPNAELDGSCYVIYGEQPFKVFEMPVPEKNTQRYILYMGSAFGPMNIRFKDEYRGGDMAGFHELDVANCKVTKYWNAPIANPSNYNSVIKYKDDYYFLVLEPSNTSTNYFLSLGSIDVAEKYCRWHPVINNTTINPGEK